MNILPIVLLLSIVLIGPFVPFFTENRESNDPDVR